jgi:hypothetical protein
MTDVMIVVGCVVCVGMLVVAIATNRILKRHLRAANNKADREANLRHAVIKHDRRVYQELATMPEAPWPSGRTYTDGDDVTHSVAAGFFAVTICGEEVECHSPLAEEVVDRYAYDVEGALVATCVICLGKESAC